jgi:hypothetical protein
MVSFNAIAVAYSEVFCKGIPEISPELCMYPQSVPIHAARSISKLTLLPRQGRDRLPAVRIFLILFCP